MCGHKRGNIEKKHGELMSVLDRLKAALKLFL